MTNIQKIRDELAKECGNACAKPLLRSMYPSKSRGWMADAFAQSYKEGFDAALKLMSEQEFPAEELAEWVQKNTYPSIATCAHWGFNKALELAKGEK